MFSNRSILKGKSSHFVNFPLGQLPTWSTSHLVNFPLCQLPTWSMLTKWETLHCLLGIGEVERGDRGREGGKRGKSITLFSLMYMSIQPPCFVVQMWMSVVKTTPCVRRGPTASTHQETISATVSYAFCHVMAMCLLACDGHVTGM